MFLPFTKQIPEQQRRYVLIDIFENFIVERLFPVSVPRGLQTLVRMQPVAQEKPYSIPRRVQVIGSAYPYFPGSCTAYGEPFGVFPDLNSFCASRLFMTIARPLSFIVSPAY
jgi:hypothetical protein